MKIRQAELKDLDAVINMFKSAIRTMISNNIYQWDDVYPNGTILKQDILKKQMYIGTEDDVIVSAAVINDESDEQYQNGNWEFVKESFAVIHRLCVNPIYQNKKYGKNTMIIIENFIKSQGIQCIRLDAFSENPYALRMYKTLGYKKAGEANWRKGLFYLFEKKL